MKPNIPFPQIKVHLVQDLDVNVEVCLKTDVEDVILEMLKGYKRMQQRAVEAETKYQELVRSLANDKLSELEDERIQVGTDLEYLENNVNAVNFLQR